MSPLNFREQTETQKLFLRLLEARGYDMRKAYDQVDPQMPLVEALQICEIINQELERRMGLILKSAEDLIRAQPMAPIIIERKPAVPQ